jgi:PAS domain S-box-containing protein
VKRAAAAGMGVPLSTYLTRLIWLCILPLLGLGGWVIYDRVRAEQAQRDEQAASLARNVATLIDQQLDARIRGLTMLAVSPLVDNSKSWPALYREAQGFQETFGTHVILAQAGEPMPMRFNTRAPLGSPLPALPRPAGRAAAPAALATLRPAVGDSFVGPVAKVPLVAIAAPVIREGKAAFVVLTTLETERFQAYIEEVALPAGWAVTLRDGRGAVLAHRWPAGFDPAVDVDPGGRFTRRLNAASWSVDIELPRAVRRAPLVTTGIALGLGLLGATLAGVLGGTAAGRRLGRAVAALTQGPANPQPAADIAEIHAARRTLEEAAARMRESEERFRRLFEDAPLAMLHVGPDGAIAARNRRFAQLFGYTEADAGTLDEWWRLVCPDAAERDQIEAKWKTAVARTHRRAGTDIDAGECRLTCRDGTHRVVLLAGIAMANGVLASFYNITERRRAERQLQLWAEAFEQAELGLAISDATTNTLIAVNPAFAQDRGYERDEMAGMPIRALFPEDRREETRAMIAALDVSPHEVFEMEHLAKNGRRFPVLLDVTVLRGADGKPVSRVAYALDLTERKRAEQALADAHAAALAQQKRARVAALNQMQDANDARDKAESALAALRESEARYRLVAENGSDVIWLFDLAADRFSYVSPSVARLRGYGVEEVLGQSIVDALTPASYRMVAEALPGRLAAFAAGDPAARIQTHEVSQPCKDGRTVPTEVVTTLIADERGQVTHIQGVTRDITERRRAEQEIQRLNSDLERRVAERTAELTATNRELDSFAYAVSHDLRAPLRAMSGFVEALREDFSGQLPADAEGYLDHVASAARRMSDLIDGLLTLSRSVRGDLRRDPVDISALARSRLEALVQAEPHRGVAWQVEAGLAAEGDRRMIDALLENLLTNAWKYTGHASEPQIRVYSGDLCGQRSICVSDNGAGFDMAHAGRLFEPFQRLHRQEEFPGIGIGLATVQRIVRRHGGEIAAHAEVGNGATFCFTLPGTQAGWGAESFGLKV